MRKFAGLWHRFWFRCIVYCITLGIVLVVTGYLCMERILLPGVRGAKTGNMVLQSSNAQLDTFWHAGDVDKPVLLFSHGNGQNLQNSFFFLEYVMSHGYSILAYDYAGYGASTGKAGERQVYQDAEAAYRFLTDRQHIPASRIILFGYSVGSGPSCYLAEKYPVKGLILAAPFASAIQVVLPFSLPGDRFPNAKRLRNTQVPVLIFHGKKDTVIPFRNGVKLYQAAGGNRKLVPVDDANHNDIFFRLGECFWNETSTFFADANIQK